MVYGVRLSIVHLVARAIECLYFHGIFPADLDVSKGPLEKYIIKGFAYIITAKKMKVNTLNLWIFFSTLCLLYANFYSI